MSVYQTVRALEGKDSLHLARLLLLVNGFSRPDRDEGIEGLTKLAKLDFLLRYPTYLERALERRHASTKAVQVELHERKSVESAMIRFRYGPWDHRYRLYINNLVGRGLVRIEPTTKSVRLQVTDDGRALAAQLLEHDDFSIVARRVQLLRTHFDMGGTRLMRFIYDTFPAITSLRFDEEIPI